LEHELCRRFDYACCETLEQFRRELQAVTRAGQIKSGGQRHEKDDRHRLDDRSRYVLGWSNEQKIAALSGQASKLERAMQGIAEKLADLQRRLRGLEGRKTTLVQLGEFRDFNDLDWQDLARAIAALEAEREELEAASNLLHTLCRQLEALETAIVENETRRKDLNRDHAKNEEKQQQYRAQLERAFPWSMIRPMRSGMKSSPNSICSERKPLANTCLRWSPAITENGICGTGFSRKSTMKTDG
jgi:uncharacterized protein YPO0396